jgi:hypothetical protein
MDVVTPKRRLTFNVLHGIISQKIELFELCLLFETMINCMEWIPSETNRRSAGQEIAALYRPRRLINVPKIPSLGLILSELNSVLTPTSFCNLLSSRPSSSVQVSVVDGYHHVSSILLKLYHPISRLCIPYECDIS